MKIISINEEYTKNLYCVAFNIDSEPSSRVIKQAYSDYSDKAKIDFRGNCIIINTEDPSSSVDEEMVLFILKAFSEAETIIYDEIEKENKKRAQLLTKISKSTGISLE